MTSRSRKGIATRAVGGDVAHAGAVNMPVQRSSAFAFDSLAALDARASAAAGRLTTSASATRRCMRAKSVANLDGAARAPLFPSGMAAISSLFLARLGAGDHVIALRQLYGGTIALLRWGEQRFGWQVDYVDARTPEVWERAFRRETRLFHVESPTNPTLCVVDLAHAAELAHRHGAWLTVDNTVATAAGQRPLEQGADAVAYSATKSMGGHSDLLAGAVSGPAANLEPVYLARKVFGPMPDPDVASRLERVSRRCRCRRGEPERAGARGPPREHHPAVERVFYPGSSAIRACAWRSGRCTSASARWMSIDVRGGAPRRRGVRERARTGALPAASLGAWNRSASIPARMSHVQLDAAGLRRPGSPTGWSGLSSPGRGRSRSLADLESGAPRAAAVRAVALSSAFRCAVPRPSRLSVPALNRRVRVLISCAAWTHDPEEEFDP